MLVRRIGVALFSAGLGLAATIGSSALGLRAPFLLPMASVMIAAWYGGLWSGLLALGVLVVGIRYYLLAPAYSFQLGSPEDIVRLALFAFVALAMSFIVERGRRTAATLGATLLSIDDAVIVTDRQGRITFMNAVAERLTGWGRAQATGRQVADVYRILDESSRQPVSSRIEGMLRDSVLREGMILGPRQERLLRSRDGAEHPVVDSGSSVVDEAGDRIGAVLVFRDVSEQRAARTALERANRLKDEFLATVSHELRTPLNAMLGWTKMLRTGAVESSSIERGIDAIDRNAHALATLVNDLLDVSRIVAGRMRLAPEEADIAQLVRDAIDTLAPSTLAKRLRLVPEIDAVPKLVVDADRLRQIVWNLLSNAIKFTPQDGEIVVRVKKVDGSVHIAVADSGQGIDPAQLPYVFDRFWQAESASGARATGGLGLGLAIVRHLVEAHGGTVAAESAGIGCGATFVVTLPIAGNPPAGDPATGDVVKAV